MAQQNSNKQSEEITKLINQIIDKKLSTAVDSYKKVDEVTNRFLNLKLNHTYFILSINTACIAFIISITINEKFQLVNLLVLSSLILWMISFFAGIMEASRTMKLMNSFTYYVLGESIKQKEISEPNKKIIEKLGNESADKRNQPLLYFIIGVIFFIFYYIVKLLLN